MATTGAYLGFIPTLDASRDGRRQPGGRARAHGRPELHCTPSAQAWEAGKLFHIDLNDQAFGRYDQDFRFGAANPKAAFFLVKFLEDVGYDGPRHFDAHAYRTEDYDGVKDFARGCMRTYLILDEKAERWNADAEIQGLLDEPRRAHEAPSLAQVLGERPRHAARPRVRPRRRSPPRASPTSSSISSPSKSCWACDERHDAGHRDRLCRLPAIATPRSASTPTPPASAFATCRSPSTAGRATTSAGSRSSATSLGGGLAVTGNYPGKARTPDELRADVEQRLLADPRQAPLQPARVLRRLRRQARRPRRGRARAFHRAGSTGRSRWASASISTRRSSRIPRRPTASRSRIATRDPRSSGSRTASPAGKIGAAIGRALGNACVTNVWIPDGMKDTPVDRVGPRERLTESLDAIFARADRPGAQPRRGRGQAVRHRLRELRRRLARVLFRLRALAQEALHARRGPLPPDRDDRRQDQLGVHVPAGDPAARQPRRPLGQRSRRRAHRRPAKRSARSWSAATTSAGRTSASTTSTPASTASPPGSSARATCSRRC